MASNSGVSRAVPILGLAAHLGRGLQRVATDALVGGLRAFPRRIADLDAPVLSRLLGRTVSSVSVIDGDGARRAVPGWRCAVTAFRNRFSSR